MLYESRVKDWAVRPSWKDASNVAGGSREGKGVQLFFKNHRQEPDVLTSATQFYASHHDQPLLLYRLFLGVRWIRTRFLIRVCASGLNVRVPMKIIHSVMVFIDSLFGR